jgi:membrane-bound ClpP family serine protease
MNDLCRQPQWRGLRAVPRDYPTVAGIAWLIFCTAPIFAQAPAPRAAFLVSVPLPISGTVDTDIKQALNRIQSDDSETTSRPIVVLEFVGEGNHDGSGSEFERCLSLARFLASDRIRSLRTVAYLPRDVFGHAVLPVLACEEIVVHPEASLGEAGRNETLIDETMRRAYSETAERRRTIPAAVALGMLESSRTVYRVTTLDGVTYAADDQIDDVRQRTTISSQEVIVQPGDFGRFSGRELRLKFGFASHLAVDRQALTDSLQLPADALEQNVKSNGQWRPLQLRLSSHINAKNVNWIIRSLEAASAQSSFNLLCFTIDSPGGSPADSIRLANFLAGLDGQSVKTIAFVEKRALGDAVLLALACDELVVSPNSKLGGPGASAISERDQPELHRAIKSLAKMTGRDWSLPVALVDPSVAVFRYRREGTGELRYFSADELREQAEPDLWQREGEISLDDGLDGHTAKEMQVAQQVAANFEQVRRIYSLPDDVEEVQPNWAHLLVERLASPKVAGMLLFVAWFALFIEFSQPGLGVAGFVSALSFLLFFWSNILLGTAGWLEVLLFLAGVLSVVIEIFVMPGLGVFGLGGAAMIITSLVLASQTFVFPRNSYQMEQIPNSLFPLVAAGAGAVVSMILLHRYLADIPVLQRILLPPRDEDDLLELDKRESLADFDYLLGKRGRTTTPLTPSGKARFGDDVVNVISDGELLAAGSDVVVDDVRGNHVQVRLLDAERQHSETNPDYS